jgi:hypothetical protein
LTDEQRAYVNAPANVDARIAQEDLAMSITGDANSNIIDAGKGLFNVEPSFDSPSSAGSYGGSLVTGGLSGDLTGIPGITGNIADNIVAAVAPEYAVGLQGQNFAESGGSTYDPNMVIENKITGGTSTGGYKFDPNAFSSDYGNANFEFSDLTPVPEPDPVEFTSLPNTGMTAIPGYTTPLPTTFEGPIPTGTTLPTGSTVVNTYDGGFESRPAHSTDNDKPAGPGDTGYEQAQLLGNLQSGGTGIIYKDDRREVYLDGVLIGNPKGAEDAREMLAKAKEKKAAAPQPLQPSSPPPPPQPSPLPADTKIKDPVSGKMLTQFQLNNRINSPNLGKAYADAGITSVDQILNPAPVVAQPSPLPAYTSTSAGMEVRALPNGTEYYVDAAGNFAGLK